MKKSAQLSMLITALLLYSCGDNKTAANVPAKEIPIYKIAANDLFLQYKENEVKQDEAMKGAHVQVWGRVKQVRKDISDNIIIDLKVANQFMAINMYMKESEKQKAMDLKSGDRIIVQCVKMSLFAGQPMGKDCFSVPIPPEYNKK